MPNNDEKQCLECGWAGDIEECPREKQWADHAGGYYISVAICPKCSSDHLATYDSQEAKDSRLQFTGEEQVENKLCSDCCHWIEEHTPDGCQAPGCQCPQFKGITNLNDPLHIEELKVEGSPHEG